MTWPNVPNGLEEMGTPSSLESGHLHAAIVVEIDT
jgi:hypothetical protein